MWKLNPWKGSGFTKWLRKHTQILGFLTHFIKKVFRLSPQCFGPAGLLSCLSRTPAASGRYLRRSCGSFLRLMFASVECGQAADTVLCQKVNVFFCFFSFPRHWRQDSGENVPLVRHRNRHACKKNWCVIHPGCIWQIFSTLFLLTLKNSFEVARWRERHTETERERENRSTHFCRHWQFWRTAWGEITEGCMHLL